MKERVRPVFPGERGFWYVALDPSGSWLQYSFSGSLTKSMYSFEQGKPYLFDVRDKLPEGIVNLSRLEAEVATV